MGRLKRLKFWFSINVLLLNISSGFSQKDSTKRTFFFQTATGVPVYNSLLLAYEYEHGDSYWVHSKSKINYFFKIGYSKRKYTFGITINSYKSDFKGRDFTVAIASGQKTGPQFKALFNIYQEVKYNITTLGFDFGRVLFRNKRNEISLDGGLCFIIHYDIHVNNYFSNDQFGNDTTNYALAKEVKVTKNFGYIFPRFSLNFNYNYQIDKHFSAGASIRAFDSPFNDPYYSGATKLDIFRDNNSTYRFEAYDIIHQVIISPCLSVKYDF